MSTAYRWAFVNPWRKIFYNITITGLSVAVALVIGTIEWLQVLISLLNWCEPAKGLDFTVHGYSIVDLFFAAWLVSVALWKLGRFDQRYGTGGTHMHDHAHKVDLQQLTRRADIALGHDRYLMRRYRSPSRGVCRGSS
jgi:nickel/cobalt transporter (NiCoT) family protein